MFVIAGNQRNKIAKSKRDGYTVSWRWAVMSASQLHTHICTSV